MVLVATMDPIRIDVAHAATGQYTIEIDAGLLGRLDAMLDAHEIGTGRFVVTTPTVWRAVAPLLSAGTAAIEPILLPDGERFKFLPTVVRVYDALIRLGADRASTLVAVGGGVLGDTAGFAAATYLRGIPLVQVPTTLLAQVDSSVGGKVGVNHPLGKNLIGAFHPPRAVLVDPEVLASLPRRELRAGLYEVVKYGVIASRALFDRVARRLSNLFAREAGALVPTIGECCAIKARIVTADERERGERRLLNFGHTTAHALEALTKYRRYRHGEAVAYGMLTAAHVATARRVLAEAESDALVSLITQMGPLPPVGDLSAAGAMDVIARDKKVIGGRLHFVLPLAIGSATVVNDVSDSELVEALRRTGLRD